MNSKRFKRIAPFIMVLIGGALCGGAAGAYIALIHDLPEIRSLEDFSPSMITRIYSREKIVLAELYTKKRDPIPLEEIPAELQTALLTMEDRKFHTHPGIDIKGVARALLADIRAGGFVEGASTITQQLAKTLFLTPEKTLIRKIREAVLALQLEKRYTKDEILELYLNQVYFGSGAYGVKSAARIFFDKSVESLSLGECALIAAMPRLPSRYSPLVNPELAVRRRNIVLKQMLAVGAISKAEYREAADEPLRLNPNSGKSIKAGYFVDYITDYMESELQDLLGSSLLYKGGLNIHTTLSMRLQDAAEKAITEGLEELEKRMADRGNAEPEPQAALVAIDVQTGAILSMVGGGDYEKTRFNRAVNAKRQPGSAFKPIVYACAIERNIPQNKTILDAPVVFKGSKTGEDWLPKNFSETFSGEITLRKALSLSKNIPAVRLIDSLGPESVIRFAKSMGVESPLTPYLSLALGASGCSLLEMTAAYSVFPRQGKRIEPFGIVEISDNKGRTIWRAGPEKAIAMSREGAAVVTNMLEGVVKEGTGRAAQVLNKTIGGKTGTTNDYKDAWFIGFSPGVAAGVWVGRDEYRSLGKFETGSRSALPIWIDFMRTATAKESFRYFDTPDNVVRVPIDPDTGERTPEDAPGSVSALFIKGSEPKYR